MQHNYDNNIVMCCKNSNLTAQLAQSSRPTKTEYDFLVRIMDLEKKKVSNVVILHTNCGNYYVMRWIITPTLMDQN